MVASLDPRSNHERSETGGIDVDLPVPCGSSSTERDGTELPAHSLVPPPPSPPIPEPPYRFDLRQQWEGTVVTVGRDEFRATLYDLTTSNGSIEEATFPLEEVSPGDLALVVPGAVFRWSIGYRIQEGQKERVSRLHFARLPGWSRRAVERIEAEAARLQRLFADRAASR